MTEHNSLFSATLSAMGMVVCEFYGHLAPWLLLGMVLVLVDLRFGVMAARKRGETIRTSRMWRRTFNKIVDYLCWVTLAEVCSRTFGVTLGAPVVGMTMLFVIYGIEVSSCVNNYLEYKGTKKRLDIFRLMGKGGVFSADDAEQVRRSEADGLTTGKGQTDKKKQ